MTPREIVYEQLQHRETDQIPYTLEFEPDVGSRLDEYFGGPGWRDRLTQYIVKTERIAKVVSMEALPRVTDVFGAVWRKDRLPPHLLEPALKAPTFKGYTFPSVEKLLNPDSMKQAKKLSNESTSFVAMNLGLCLWHSWYLRGFEETMMDCVAEEEFYTELLDRMTQLTVEVINKCKDTPADAIMMGDDWGDQRGVLIGPERWRKFFKPRYARIFEAVHEQGKVAIMHCCGSVADIMAEIIEIGLDVLESVQPEAASMNPYELKKGWGKKIAFWGGLGSQSTIPFAKPAEIHREIQRLRSEMSRGGGYILAPAKALRPETPTENAVAVVEEFLGQEAKVT